jgi:bla regulator protein BlaR1
VDGDDEEAAVRLIVEGFGQRMQNVELLSGEVQSQIRNQYGPFASDDMIEEWLEEPSRAPGREVSSPWPARIEIYTIEEEGVDTYRVHAWVKYVDSEDSPGEASAEQSISLLVSYNGSSWVIVNYATTGAYTTLD